MKIIMTAEPEEMEGVLKLILDNRDMFERHPQRLGWGWTFWLPSRKRFFLARIKGGVSARPADPAPQPRSERE